MATQSNIVHELEALQSLVSSSIKIVKENVLQNGDPPLSNIGRAPHPQTEWPQNRPSYEECVLCSWNAEGIAWSQYVPQRYYLRRKRCVICWSSRRRRPTGSRTMPYLCALYPRAKGPLWDIGVLSCPECCMVFVPCWHLTQCQWIPSVIV